MTMRAGWRKRPLCSHCDDAARSSFCNELRAGLKARNLWAPTIESDLLNAVFQVIDTKSGDCREGRCTVLKKAEAMGIESADLDDLIHELMANCAAYGELGGKELLRRLTEIAKEKRSG